jgi:hypothetical protein
MRRRARATIAAVFLSLAVLTLAAPLAAGAEGGWAPGPGAVLDNTYDGFIDLPSANATVPTGSFTVAGWFVDQTAEGWAGADDVQVWLGTMDGGGRLLVKPSFAQNRPDVAAAQGNPYWAPSGFAGVMPANALAAGPQTLSVYVHTPAKGWWFQQVQVNVSTAAAAAPVVSGAALPIVAIEKPKDSETVLTNNPYDIIGYALDRNATPSQGVAGSGIDRVQVYLGAERENGGQFLGDADLGFSDPIPVALYGPQFASAGWRLTFKPTQFHANTYLLFAYAHSAVSGKEDVAVRYFAIRER